MMHQRMKQTHRQWRTFRHGVCSRLLQKIYLVIAVFFVTTWILMQKMKQPSHEIQLFHVWTGPFKAYHKFWAQSCKKNSPKLSCILITDQDSALEGVITIQQHNLMDMVQNWLTNHMGVDKKKIQHSMAGNKDALVIQSMKHYFSEIFNIPTSAHFVGFGDMDQIYGNIELLFEYEFWKYDVITISQPTHPENDRIFTRGQFTIYNKEFKRQIRHEDCFSYLKNLVDSGENWDIKATEGCFSVEVVENESFLQIPIAYPKQSFKRVAELMSSWAKNEKLDYEFNESTVIEYENSFKCVGGKNLNENIQKAVEKFARCSNVASVCPIHREKKFSALHPSRCDSKKNYLFLHYHGHKTTMKFPENVCEGDVEISESGLKCININ